MKFARAGLLVLILSFMVLGCSTASAEPIIFEPGHLDPDFFEPKVDQFVFIFDASESMSEKFLIRRKLSIAQDLFIAMNLTIPELDYYSGMIVFGGQKCLGEDPFVVTNLVGPYDKDALDRSIVSIPCASGASRLASSVKAALKLLPDLAAPTSIIVISDGEHMGGAEARLAKKIRKKLGDHINIYTVQIGHNPNGRQVLESMALATAEGFHINALALTSTALLEEFVIEALLFVDEDGDGIPNVIDLCPGTPRGAVVDIAGCPADDDGDGVANNLDLCPGTPAGIQVDAAGCPFDTDGDGIPDNLDRCPGTPARTLVDANGCPVEGVEVVNGGLRVSGSATFATGSATLSAAGKAIFAEVAGFLVRNPQYEVEIQGHTDSTGSLEVNKRISQQRADAVRAYLVSEGVAAERLIARGYGPDFPIASNDTAEGRAKNRRVEFVPLN